MPQKLKDDAMAGILETVAAVKNIALEQGTEIHKLLQTAPLPAGSIEFIKTVVDEKG